MEPQMTHRFDPTVLREYDIRGIIGETLGADYARALGRGFAALATAKARESGGRPRWPRPLAEFEAALIEGLTAGGLDVVRSAWARRRCSISRSHARRRRRHPDNRQPQPANYNGFKMLLNGARSSAEIQTSAAALREAIGRRLGQVRDEILDDMSRAGQGLDGKLQDRLGRGQWRRRPRAREARQAVPGEHHLLYTEVDGNFPNHHPDPTVEANRDLKKLVAEKNLDFGIASTATATASARSTARAA